MNCSQCLRGVVTSDYNAGRILRDAGVIMGRDLTTEAAMTKLSYVLAKKEWDLATKRRMMETSLRGEMRDG